MTNDQSPMDTIQVNNKEPDQVEITAELSQALNEYEQGAGQSASLNQTASVRSSFLSQPKIWAVFLIVLIIIISAGIGWHLYRQPKQAQALKIDVKKVAPEVNLDGKYALEFEAVVKKLAWPKLTVITLKNQEMPLVVNDELICLRLPRNYKEQTDIMQIINQTQALDCQQDIKLGRQYFFHAFREDDQNFYLSHIYDFK